MRHWEEKKDPFGLFTLLLVVATVGMLVAIWLVGLSNIRFTLVILEVIVLLLWEPVWKHNVDEANELEMICDRITRRALVYEIFGKGTVKRAARARVIAWWSYVMIVWAVIAILLGLGMPAFICSFFLAFSAGVVLLILALNWFFYRQAVT